MTHRILLFAIAACALAQTPRTNVTPGRRYPRLVIRGAIVVDGSGTPAAGPKDIVIENNTITDVVALDGVALSRGEARRPQGDVEIDATGNIIATPASGKFVKLAGASALIALVGGEVSVPNVQSGSDTVIGTIIPTGNSTQVEAS